MWTYSHKKKIILWIDSTNEKYMFFPKKRECVSVFSSKKNAGFDPASKKFSVCVSVSQIK